MRIPPAVTRFAFRQALVLKKQAPHILFGAGMVGVVGSTVLACKATLKLGDTLDAFETDVAKAKAISKLEGDERYSAQTRRQVLPYAYARGTANIIKLYGPAVIVGVISVAALTGSHVVLSRRNVSLTAAYAALMKAYDEYRDRVRDELGTDKELDVHRGITRQQITGDDGKTTEIATYAPGKSTMYSRIFDEFCPNWQKNNEMNRMYLEGMERHFNDLLIVRGHVFLNEIYDALGFDRSQAGQWVGWVIGPNGKDNYIDFGIYEAANTRFVNGWERSIILDFNVDGIIWKLI